MNSIGKCSALYTYIAITTIITTICTHVHLYENSSLQINLVIIIETWETRFHITIRNNYISLNSSCKYGTAQFKLYTRVKAHTCKLQNWRVYALLHAVLVCARGSVNTREMHVTSLHLVCHTTRVV